MNGVDPPDGIQPAHRSGTVAQARAEAEAARALQREAREQQLREAFAEGTPGRGVMIASWVATVLLLGVSVVALVDREAIGVYFVTTVSLFFGGVVLLAADVVLAAVRSTRNLMGIGGLFFLVDSAPRQVRRSLNGSLAVAVSVSVGTAVVGLSTPELAFGTLAPLLQLSLSGLWGVRHGTFDEREDGSGAS